MTDRKFTGDDVIKGFELCFTPKGTKDTCTKCPFHEFGALCKVERDRAALALINRQKAEIERLKDGWDYIPANAAQALKEHAVAEAIKEFAERLKQIDAEEEFACCDKWGLTYVDDEKYRNAIDTLAKEMTEESKR